MCTKHACPQNSFLSFQPLYHQGIVDLHKAGIGFKTISNNLDKKVTAVDVINQKWKKYKMTTNLSWSGALELWHELDPTC